MNRTTKECRAGKPCEPVSITEAAKCLLLHSSMPIEDIAKAVGKSEGYLRKASNADYDTLMLQADTLVAATVVTRNLVALRFIASEVGAVVVAMPTNAVDDAEVTASFMRTTKELGDVGAQIGEALANNGRIDPNEVPAIAREIEEHITAAAAMLELVKSKAQTGGRA